MTRQGRAREGRSSTKEGLPKSVHTVDTLTSFHKSSPQLFHSIPQTGSDKSSRTRQVPNVVNLLRVLTVFCEIFMPDRVTDCKSLDTLDAAEGGSSHSHSPERQRGNSKLKQTMTVAAAQIFQERGIWRINLPPKLPSEVGVSARGRRLWCDRNKQREQKGSKGTPLAIMVGRMKGCGGGGVRG